MNTLFEKYKWLKFVLGALIIAFGVAIIILAAVNKAGEIGKVINILVAIGLFTLGAFLLVTSLLSETHKPMTFMLFVSAVIITLGVVVLLMRFRFHIDLTGLLLYLLAVFLITFGSIALVKAIFLIVYKQKPIFIILMFVFAALGITAGILGLCFASRIEVKYYYFLLGVVLIAAGTIFIALPTRKKN